MPVITQNHDAKPHNGLRHPYITFSSLHFTLILNFPTAIPQGSIIEQFVHDNFVVRLHVLVFLLLEWSNIQNGKAWCKEIKSQEFSNLNSLSLCPFKGSPNIYLYSYLA